MKYKDAIDFFNNYRNHINDKSKVTIGYNNTIKIVEAYELLEGHIQDLTEECTRKQNLIDVQNKLGESMQCCGNFKHQGYSYGEDFCLIEKESTCKTNFKNAFEDFWEGGK